VVVGNDVGSCVEAPASIMLCSTIHDRGRITFFVELAFGQIGGKPAKSALTIL
jgi:hypothetical protein